MSESSTSQQKKTEDDHYQSIIRLLAILIVAVFSVETMVMLVVDTFPPMPRLATVLLDSTFLSLLLFPIFYFLVFRPLLQNITSLKKAEEELRIAAVALEIKDPILITDANANIVRVNKMLCHITGYNKEELIGQNPRVFNSGRQNKAFYEKMWQQLLRTGFWSGEIRNKSKEGHVNPCRATITAVKNENQETTHYVAIYHRM